MTTAALPGSAQLADFAPMAERASSIDELSMLRLRGVPGEIAGFVRLPYDVLAGRTLSVATEHSFDVTVSVSEFLRWADEGGPEPTRRDAHWLSALPPREGWRRIDTVPDDVIRELVRSGAALAQSADSKPAQQALLSTIVLTVSGAGQHVEVPLGPLSGLTRMGFLPRATAAAIDVAAGWIRVAAPYGSTYAPAGLSPLGMLGIGG
jgi:hypothetical protein